MRMYDMAAATWEARVRERRARREGARAVARGPQENG